METLEQIALRVARRDFPANDVLGVVEVVKEVFAELAKQDQKYGCHCDLEDGMEPDECVIDSGNFDLCVYAKRNKQKEKCDFWRPIKVIRKTSIPTPELAKQEPVGPTEKHVAMSMWLEQFESRIATKRERVFCQTAFSSGWDAAQIAAPTPEDVRDAALYRNIKPIIDQFPEINPSNYDHDDACRLNAWGIELVLADAAMTAAQEGK